MQSLSGYLREMLGKFSNPKHLAILAGWEPVGHDLQRWTIQQRATAEENRDQWYEHAQSLKPRDLHTRLREEMAEQEREVVNMERAAASEQRKNRQPTATEKEKEEQSEREDLAKRNAAVTSTFYCMRTLLADLPTTVIIGTDGGGILADPTTDPPTDAKAGWGVTVQVATGPWQQGAAGPLEVKGELWGAVELDPESPHFVGCKRLTNHTGELTAMVMALSLLLTVRLRHAIIYYDAETDAASLQHDHSPPGKNSAVISIGRELRKLVERRGTTLHWVKVLGHSDDVINDRADALATDGMTGNSSLSPS